MTYLDDLKGKHIFGNGAPLPDRKNLRFIGLSLTATDDPATDSTTINFDGTTVSGDIEIDAGGSFGIGTGGSPQPNSFHIVGPSNPQVRLESTAGSYFAIVNENSGDSSIDHVSASGSAVIEVNPYPQDGSSVAGVHLFRDSFTSGVGEFIIMNPGTASTQHALNAGIDSEICRSSGNLLLGSATNAADLTMQAGASVSVGTTTLDDVSANTAKLSKQAASGLATIDVDPIPSDATSNSYMRVAPNTVTAGDVLFQVCMGDGTTTTQHMLRTGNNSILCNEEYSLTLGSATNAANLTMQEGARIGIGTSSVQDSANFMHLRKQPATGDANVRLHPQPLDGTSGAFVSVFRDTNTTGTRNLITYKGDGTGTQQHVLSSSAGSSLCLDTGSLTLGSGTNAADVIMQGGAKVQIDETELRNGTDGISHLTHTAAAGSSEIRLDPKTSDGTSGSQVRLFRDTSTTGSRELILFKGDGGSTPQHRLQCGTKSQLCLDTGDLEVGSGTNAADVIMQGGAKVQIDETVLENVNGNITSVAHASATGTARVSLAPLPGDGVSNAQLYIFRDANTTGGRVAIFYKGDGTGTEQHVLSSSGDSELCKDTGNLEVGSAGNAADVILHNGCRVITGTGSPEGAVTAPVGSMYTRADGGAGSTLYIKESGTGNTGWVAK